jgi:hypothetical protein
MRVVALTDHTRTMGDHGTGWVGSRWILWKDDGILDCQIDGDDGDTKQRSGELDRRCNFHRCVDVHLRGPQQKPAGSHDFDTVLAQLLALVMGPSRAAAHNSFVPESKGIGVASIPLAAVSNGRRSD